MTLNVLLLTGGHGYDHNAFNAMWKALDGVSVREVQYPAAEAFFKPDAAAEFDAFVFYDFAQTMSADARADFLRLLQRGKGMVFLHHALCGHDDWPVYKEIVGGAWFNAAQTVEGRVYGPAQYTLDQTVAVKVCPHAVTQGLQDFEMIEETYKSLYVAPGLTPLLTTTHPKSDPLLGWAHQYEQSRIVFLQPGHGASVFNDSNYRRLVLQAIQWASDRT